MAISLFYFAGPVLLAIYYFLSNLSRKFNYFKERGIPQLETEFFYGNSRELVQQKKCQGELFRDFYFKFKEMGVKHGGVYHIIGESWIPIDPQLIKNILTKDFVHFSAHCEKIPGLFFHNLFGMYGEEWRDMRKKLTTAFTSGKMKMLFDIVLDKTERLSKLAGKMYKTGGPVEIKELMARYTSDVIVSCGFGIECKSIDDANSEFFEHVKDGFKSSDLKGPSIFKMFLIYFGLVKPDLPNFETSENFFREVVRETLKYREENKVIRKDFLHILIQLKNKGVINDVASDNYDVYEKTVKKDVISLEDLTGQCMMFFTAGFETSSTTMSYAMLEMTQNQDVQEKLREEVREVLKKHNGKLSYEALQEMTYCENVILEALRKRPALSFLIRMCTKDYTIPGTNSIIEKGTSVIIPHWGLQMDPDYFPEPEKFIPDRFNAENRKNIKDFTYMPFGEGPRMCLGLKLGIIQTKAGIATLVNKYKFTLNKKTPYPPEYKKKPFVLGVEGGVWLDAVEAD